MAYIGYIKYAGTEIINVARLRKYQQALGLAWFKPGFEDSQYMEAMLGEAYTTPALDSPWLDRDNVDSADFYGVYPLSIKGIEDSTRDAQVTESVLDGGVVGRLREATRSIVFEVVLLAGSECGADYGFNWLKKALKGANCAPNSTTNCAGDQLDFFSCAPFYDPHGVAADTIGGVPIVRAVIDGGYFYAGDDYSVDTPVFDGGTPAPSAWVYTFDGGTPSSTGGILTPPYSPPFDEVPPTPPTPPFGPQDCLPEFERHFRNVAFTDGPTITKKKELTNGDQVWTATFTAVCGVPWQFGSPTLVASGWLGASFEWGPDEGTFNDAPVTHVDEACLPAAWEPLTDPLCPALVPPPSVPETALGCFSAPSVWTRRQFTVSEDLVPEWGDVVPVLTVTTPFAEMRNLRVRFYSDDGTHVVTETCTPVADFLFQYLPISYTVVVDAEARVVYAVDTLGNQRRADSLVYASDGTPFEWPVLSCGEGLIVTTDLPQDSLQAPEVSLSLVSRGA